MSTRALPDMYALSPWASAIHIRQSTRAHVITITYSQIPADSATILLGFTESPFSPPVKSTTGISIIIFINNNHSYRLPISVVTFE